MLVFLVMPRFGRRSQDRLDTCHRDWHIILNYVVRFIDCTILEGQRGQVLQDLYFKNGTSKVKFPDGSHNTTPSEGVDVGPWPEVYDDKEKCYYLAGVIKMAAEMLYEQGKITHKIRWGGDWDMDNDLKDQSFFDLVHFELVRG